MTDDVRPVGPADWPLLPKIERSGEALFAEIGIVFPAGPMVIEGMLERGAEILVAGRPPLGFAAVIELDGQRHLEQLSVDVAHLRQGVGGRLLHAVTGSSPGGVTLLTFRDVPWNGPWYSRHGFLELPEDRWGPGLRDEWQAEIDAGLHRLGPRLVMRSSGTPADWRHAAG